MDIKKIASVGLGITGIATGVYLALSFFQNSNTANLLFGWALGLLGVAVLFIDGFGGKGNWKGRINVALAITGIMTAVYLIPTWIPNNASANAALGWLLLALGLIVFIKDGFD